MKLRLFLTCWVVFSLHFATNVVREHYPAFSLVGDGDFRLDEYAGFHADIFEHRDGHHYIGNQITGSLPAALVLFVFDPVLDHLEEIRVRQIREGGQEDREYVTDKPNAKAFFRKVRERGLDLRFGAATAVTSVFLMAPISALFVVLMFSVLKRRGVAERRAAWLAILFAFATPVFYRSANLNHNVFLTIAVFGSFLLLWPRWVGDVPVPGKRVFWAGFLAGLSLALDYAGIIPLFALFGYLLWIHARAGGPRAAVRPAVLFVIGSVPPVLFLLWSQWLTFGDPFKPGQLWMPDQNVYVHAGARGFTAPDPELFLRNLVDLDWGLFAFAPVLLIALVPARFYDRDTLILPRRERVFVLCFAVAFMLFNAMNQYSRLQFNTGFRYLLPLVPFLFLAVSDHLVRMRGWVLGLLSVPLLLHGFALGMVRHLPTFAGDVQAVPECWRRLLTEGPQFPWLNVIRATPTLQPGVIGWGGLPWALVLATGAFVATVWLIPRRR